MTSFDIAAITPEVSQVVKDSRIDNIYQISPTSLLLKLHQPNQPPIYLLIDAGRRLHITSYVLKKPQKPPTFCMALRKYLKNGRVLDIRQHEFERTVVIEVNTKEGEFHLISELFGGGNIILVSPQNKILQALTYRKMRDRNIWRGDLFQYAPQRGANPLGLNRRDMGEIKNLGELGVVRALTRFLSIGGLYAEEILLRAQVEKGTPSGSLTEEEINRIFIQLQQILSPLITGNIEPRIVVDEENRWVDVTPIPLEKYAHFQQKTYKTFNKALDDYYAKMGVKERVVEVAEEAEREIARQQRILQRQQRALNDLKKRIKRNRETGDVIYRHFNELQVLLERTLSWKRSGKPWKQVVLDTEKEKEAGQSPAIYFHSLEPERLILNVLVETLTFPLSLRRSAQANAANYYARAKKAKKKLEGVKKALQETKLNIKGLQRQRVERVRETRMPPPKRRQRMWYEKFRWFHSSNGFLVIGGRDATTNEILIKKYMESHDRVFHADIPGAPFVLVKTEGKSPPKQTMNEAAQLAASYSRAWRHMLGAVDVYWFFPQQVSKSPPPGQQLKKGSFMISGQKNFVRNVPLGVAIGIKVEGERLTVVGGPIEAVTNQTNIYVRITLGRETSGRLAKQIRGLLAEKAPKALQKRFLGISLEEIQGFIPAGRGRML